jgi:hypothetical protein
MYQGWCFSTHGRGMYNQHVITKELLGTLVASTRTSGKKVAQHLGLSRR